MSNNLEKFLINELECNLKVLIDPKKKDSFSSNRINTWSRLVVDRILIHLDTHLDKNNKK
jgi:hypothetical protein